MTDIRTQRQHDRAQMIAHARFVQAQTKQERKKEEMNKFKVIAHWSDGGKFESAWVTRDSIEEQVASMVRNLNHDSAVNIVIVTTDAIIDGKCNSTSELISNNPFEKGSK